MKKDFTDPSIYENEIAQAIVVLAQAVSDCAYQIKCLGTGDASTKMGAIEFLAMEVKQGLMELAGSR